MAETTSVNSYENKENNDTFRKPQPKINPKEQLIKLCHKFLNTSDTKYAQLELEAKFGTKGVKRLTRLDYDNVVKRLLSMGFTFTPDKYSLKIQPEFIDLKTGRFKTTDIDNFRVEIKGSNIQKYCQTNILPDNVKIMKKTVVKIDDKVDNSGIYEHAEFDDFNFRVGLKLEEQIDKKSKLGQDLIDNWPKAKKIFRYLNRTSFRHADHPEFWFDLSIVRSSSKNERGYMIPTYNMDESDVLVNPDTFDIECEVDGQAALAKYANNPQGLANEILKMTKIVLCGLQKTNFPISYPEQKFIIQNYMRLLFEDEFKKKGEQYFPKDKVYPSDFIGPQPKALQIKNITPINEDIIVPNITETDAFCVTDKADGERQLLYVNRDGKIYLISTSMTVMFTGAITENKEYFNSLLDGELILNNKQGKFINQYAAFDIYYINGVDVRARPFNRLMFADEKYFKDGVRLSLLKEFVSKLNPNNILTPKTKEPQVKLTGMKAIMAQYAKIGTANSPIRITCKNFYPLTDIAPQDKAIPTLFRNNNIFEACYYILQRVRNGLYDYHVDGLIFTPNLLGVGSNKILEAGPKRKITWDYSFKWKPSEATETFTQSYLTIDFLVTTKKDNNGKDIITPIFQDGVDAYQPTQFEQYKTLILAVGYDESKHGFVNPCQDLLEDIYPDSRTGQKQGDGKKDSYKPKQFYPTEPYDPSAGLCNIMLTQTGIDSYKMMTEEGDVFDDQTVVEFKYDSSKPGLWKWIPLRVRYDKTADFRAGLNSFGNDYKTANDNWYSIHNPVTEKMIATGTSIPSVEIGDVYYNSTIDDKLTKRMRDFHNLYVKKKLITAVSKKGDILIDFACGKAGDLPKWIAAGLAFVFGIDISKDNIENRLNGACARYLNLRRDFKTMPYALFVNGNSALNIRSGTNMFTDKANEITKSVFGSGTSDKGLGPAVKRQFSRGINGFDVSSCQFALHYMFENKTTFYNFLRNVSECTRINGYFIATAYDGKTIFNMLRKYNEGETRDIYIDGKKVWSVQKNYDATKFPEDDTSLGYKISVYQDTINQSIPEYLINFDFLTREMEKYGFNLINRAEARQLGLPESSGMFSELYNMMLNELDKDPSKAKDYKDAPVMNDYEKDISFLNRFFVYKKTSSRNAEKLTKAILENLPDEYEFEQGVKMLARETVKKVEEEIKPKAKKLKEKLMLQEATEALEEKAHNKTVKEPQNTDELLEDIFNGPAPETKPKKTTRKKKPLVEFDIIEE